MTHERERPNLDQVRETMKEEEKEIEEATDDKETEEKSDG
jgi:uncharacterized iron-regulated protein